MTALIAGIMISSPITYTFPFFAILREILYDVFSPPSLSELVDTFKIPLNLVNF